MRFRDLIELDEAKFTPPTRAVSVQDSKEAIQIAGRILQQTFPQHAINVDEEGIQIMAADRYLHIVAYSVQDPYLGASPQLEIEFGWRRGYYPTDVSSRDMDTSISTRKQVGAGTLQFAQRFRDFLRRLSQYAIGVSYIAMGERRERWYSSIMKSAGYEEEHDGMWMPKAMLVAREEEQRRRYGM